MSYNTSTFYYPISISIFGPHYMCHQFEHLYCRGRSSMQGIIASNSQWSNNYSLTWISFLVRAIGSDKLKRYSCRVSKIVIIILSCKYIKTGVRCWCGKDTKGQSSNFRVLILKQRPGSQNLLTLTVGFSQILSNN